MSHDPEVPVPDGESRRAVADTPISPWTLVIWGVVSAVVGAGVFVSALEHDGSTGFGELVGLAVAGLGGVVLLLGVVAGGVVLGLRYHRDGPT